MSTFIPRTLAFANGKGGVGKTSMTANCGGLAAAGGWRVLLVDFDPQGDLCQDLGYPKDDGSDLLNALITGQPVPVKRQVRERLDVVPSGLALADVNAVLLGRAARQQDSDRSESFGDLLYRSLNPIADDYDLIVFDLPPGEPSIVRGTLECTRALVIPTRADDASINAIAKVARDFTHARRTNENLRLAGVAMFQLGVRSSRLRSRVESKVVELIGSSAPVFEAHVRHLESAAYDLRDNGLLAHELESKSAVAQGERLRALRTGATPTNDFLSRSSSGLAEDYERLTMEIFARMREFDMDEAADAGEVASA